MRTPVWIDGHLLDPADATVRYDDHGITVGDGAFETIKLQDGRPFALTRHLRRLERSLDALMLPAIDIDELETGIAKVCAAHEGGGFLRVTVTAGRGPLGSPRDSIDPTVIVAVRPGCVRDDPADVITVPFTRNEHGALAGVKSTSYAENVVALAMASEAGAEEALFANTSGHLCEGTGSNVFVVLDGRLLTPPLSSGCLAGVTRALMLELLGDAVEEDVSMIDLGRVNEAFLTSTGREGQPIRAIDGVRIAACPGPHTGRARSAWSAAFGPEGVIDP